MARSLMQLGLTLVLRLLLRLLLLGLVGLADMCGEDFRAQHTHLRPYARWVSACGQGLRLGGLPCS